MRWWALGIVVFLALAFSRCESPHAPTAADLSIGARFPSSALPDQFRTAQLLAAWRRVNIRVRQADVSEQCILHVYKVSATQIKSFLADPTLTDERIGGSWRTRGYMRSQFAKGAHHSGFSGLESELATSSWFPLKEGPLCEQTPPFAYLRLVERGSQLWWEDRVPVLVSGGQIGGGGCCGPRVAVFVTFGILDLDERRLYLLLRVIPVFEL